MSYSCGRNIMLHFILWSHKRETCFLLFLVIKKEVEGRVETTGDTFACCFGSCSRRLEKSIPLFRLKHTCPNGKGFKKEPLSISHTEREDIGIKLISLGVILHI